MMANLDDLLLEERQLNQPGTVDEYPNWRRRMGRSLEDLKDQASPNRSWHPMKRTTRPATRRCQARSITGATT